jgi:hypothetical protein
MRQRPQRRLTTITGLAFAIGTGLLILASHGGSPGQGYVGSHTFDMADPHFGGLSALELSADGNGLVALSDRGTFVTARLTRDDSGAVTSVNAAVVIPMLDADGLPLAPNRDDSEGLAIAADGALFVAQEGPARVLRYAAVDAAPTELPRHPAFAAMQRNSALEALAIDGEGRLYTLPERSGQQDRPFPVFRLAGETWDQPFDIPREGGFLPVGADFGPDGRLYLLERDFRWLLGFETRVRRFQITGDRISAGETLVQTPAGAHQNLEGLAVWRDAQGALRLTLLSDDNFRFFLRTTLVDYRLPD